MKVFLGLGSNIGDRMKFINSAIEMIEAIEGVSIIKKASIYETEPWGVKDQENFLNTVIEIESSLPPEELYIEIKEIERRLERTKMDRWAEREIDIDILFCEDNIIETERLKVPHREIENRRFVLIPMCEIASNFIHPGIGKSIKELLENTDDTLGVNKYSG